MPSDGASHDVLTVGEVAEWLRVTPQTVRRLIAEGQLPAKMVGREWRLQRCKVQAFLDAADSEQMGQGDEG